MRAHYRRDKMLTPLKNTLFLELFIIYNCILNHFKIKVMAPQISVNFLFGGMENFKIGHFHIYLNLNRKFLIALATFNKNDLMNVGPHE